MISGAWDKTVLEWDLNTGSIVREYTTHNSQISSVAFQPKFVAPFPLPTRRENEDDDHIEVDRKDGGFTSAQRDDNKDKEDKDEDMNEKGEGAEAKENSKADDDEEMGDVKNATVNEAAGAFDDGRESNIILTTSIDGNAFVWDRRVPNGVARKLGLPERTPPWCLSACWSADGTKIYAGRRNGTVDEWDFASQKHIRSFRMPANSGPVSYVTSMPNGKHIICASTDNIRMWNTSVDTSFTIFAGDEGLATKPSKLSSVIPFSILPGHHGGIISQILIDPTCHYMITTSGNRGWDGGSTNACLFYEITPIG
ncbi:WD40-repeat-containing domain protein [Jimgerdemannia flammicorona]|uniref:WD40-repeat-containing domain protein n=2 Tax=Jimgerdemannia flammicorona TaxID=994334 RepID=A0A433DLU6_9FUNG|nr:WD40-repeat-containing domain protein [Jimgerdemannia flammicorona]RUS35393.1 hypothetical protein BC938DRAFT_470847 [Jimgerdemannia flammicorona]